MASLPPNDQVVFIMNVLQNTEMPKPDYHAVARNTGSTSANTAYVTVAHSTASSPSLESSDELTLARISQKKFKAIAKAAGFDLVNDRIVRIGDPVIPSPAAASRTKKRAAGGNKAANSTPKKKTTDNGGTPVKGSKKRKIDDVAEDAQDEMNGNDQQTTEEESAKGKALNGGDAE
ncbi:hypothetical protein LTR84_013015 [Exophiala bonariae]|uniref:Myb-like DNA-binding domain-containing protein n=1 Tax=Exophiala bonariae TaxID=1690606 RepID=A0AAV9NDQ8_9EURO|nr:hypothetical protein LTR84_013015 [Exophiala bonariae]